MTTDNLLNRRVIFVVGKGGAGKTTIAAALAMAAAKNDKKVLVAETQENDALGMLFGHTALTEKPSELLKNIWGVRINSKMVLDEYIKRYVTVGFVAYQIIHSRIFEHLAVATPGLKEVMTLSEIWRFEQKQNPETKSFLYDHIIVDSPATGHGLSLLQVPSTLTSMFQTGPIATQTRWVQEMLQDSARTCLLVVTLAEELPVNEALEFERKAENDLDMKVVSTIVNMVYPDIFSPDETAAVEQLKSVEKIKDHPFIEAARRHIARRKLQQFHIHRLLDEGEHPVFQLPFYDTNSLAQEQIADIAEHIRKELFNIT
ncbi:MAG: ArsA family ATPase [Desulfobacterales bacterium]